MLTQALLGDTPTFVPIDPALLQIPPTPNAPHVQSTNGHFTMDGFGSFVSHAARNPLQPVIPPQNKRKAIDKQSAEVAWAIRQQKQDEFAKDLTVYQESQRKVIEDLATKERATNLYNAKVAWKRRQLNQDRLEGNCLCLSEIQVEVRKDPWLQNLTKEEEAELIRQLEEEKRIKKRGAQINNRAATLNYQYTVHRLEHEVAALGDRMGVTGFAFFSRSHVNDSMQPEWISTPGALSFLPETLQTMAGELGRKFELWSCTKGDRKVKNELVRLQSECSETIIQKLREIVNRQDVSMSYWYYDVDIRARWKVQLCGWPEGVRFIAPRNITTLHEIRMLHEALHCGECSWVPMTQQEVSTLATKLKDHPVVRTRKPRRSNRENVDLSAEAEGSCSANVPRRRRRAAPKSNPVVQDDAE